MPVGLTRQDKQSSEDGYDPFVCKHSMSANFTSCSTRGRSWNIWHGYGGRLNRVVSNGSDIHYGSNRITEDVDVCIGDPCDIDSTTSYDVDRVIVFQIVHLSFGES